MRKPLYLLLAMLLLGRPEPASACSELLNPPYEQFAARASSVFVGHIVRTEVVGTKRRADHLPPAPVVEATVRVVEMLKGEPPADGKVRAFAEVHCNVRLMAGQDYAIFLYQDNFIRGRNEELGFCTKFGVPTRKACWSGCTSSTKRIGHACSSSFASHKKACCTGRKNDCESWIKNEQAVANASTVFVGHLIRTEEAAAASISDTQPTPVIEATFKVLEVLKGQAPPDGKVRTSLLDERCLPLFGLHLVPGNDYLVFLDQDNFIRGPDNGSRYLLGGFDAHTQQWLEKLRGLSSKAQ